MTEQQTTAIDVNEEVLVLETPITGRQFMVVGAQCVPEKYLALLTKILDMPNPATGAIFGHNVRNVILSPEGFPMKADGTMRMGMAVYQTNSIIISLLGHLEEAMGAVKKQGCEISFRTHIWLNLMVTATHEMLHMAKWNELLMAGKIDEALKEEHDEDAIEELALSLVFDLAKQVDVEIPALDDWPWFEGRIIDFEKSFAGAKEGEGWKATQSALLGDGTTEGHTVWMSLQTDLTCKTMHEYLLGLSKEDPKQWEGPKQQLLLNAAAVEPIIATTAEEQQANVEAEFRKLLEKAQADFIKELNLTVHQAKGGEPTDEEVNVTDGEIALFLSGRGTTLEAELKTIEDNMRAECFGNPVITEAPDGSLQGMTFPQGQAVANPEPDDGFYGGYEDETYGMGFDPNMMGGFNGAGFSQPSQPSNVMQQWNQAPAPVQKQATLPKFMDTAQAGPLLQRVYERLYHHMFTKCGWAQVQTPQGPTWRFTVPGAIAEPVDLSDIPNIGQLIVGMDTMNERGQYLRKVPLLNGTHVKGLLSKQAGLPEYILYTNHGDGVERIRLLIAQNPDKMKNGALSQWAQRARQGERMALLFDKEVPIGQPGGMKGSFQNGQWVKAN